MQTYTVTLILLFVVWSSTLTGQAYPDYIGAGHTRDIIVNSSSDHSKAGWSEIADGSKTIDASGMEWEKMQASRFLHQASIGFDPIEIDSVLLLGYEGWIDKQISQGYTSYTEIGEEVIKEWDELTDRYGLFDSAALTKAEQNTVWWRMNMLKRDFLREKVCLALSELLVVSQNSNVGAYGFGVLSYFDLLKRNAFGNYRDLLLEVSYHPAMGDYLSHMGNQKEDPEKQIFPDENYAREIMQLFTIGLEELNIDGTTKVDVNGESIPTYDNNDIAEMARVFTGLGAEARYDFHEGLFILPPWGIDFTKPMERYEELHDTEEKNPIDDLTLAPNQSIDVDIAQTIDYLVSHPNTAPFISMRLIQHLVTSNPSTAYVQRVAEVFVDDGNGVRGNLEAVIKQILLDSEARDCEASQLASHGRLRKPSERQVHFIRNLGYEIESDSIYNSSNYLWWSTNYQIWNAPSVFNFHEPDYSPTGPIGDLDLVAPEFQLYNASTSVGYANVVFRHFYLWKVFGWNPISEDFVQLEQYQIYPHIEALVGFAAEPEVLINHLDVQYCAGKMTQHTRSILKTLLVSINSETVDDDPHYEYDGTDFSIHLERVRQAMSIILLCPEFNIIK